MNTAWHPLAERAVPASLADAPSTQPTLNALLPVTLAKERETI